MQCKAALERLYTFKQNLEFALEKSNTQDRLIEATSINLKIYKSKFIEAMDDDLNTADALSVIFELVKDVNTNILSNSNLDSKIISNITNIFDELTGVLGILYENQDNASRQIQTEEIKNLLNERELARKEKNWKRADEIRDQLKEKNVIIEDTPQGAKFIFK